MINIKKINNSKGFTVVELLIVIAIIGILAAITFVAYNGFKKSAIKASIAAELSNCKKGLEMYKVENGSYPTETIFSQNSTKYNCPVENETRELSYDADGIPPQTYILTETQNGVTLLATDKNSEYLEVTGLNWSSVSAGIYTTCALTTENYAYCWGFGGAGQLGNNTLTSHQTTPTLVSKDIKFKHISAAGYHVCAISTDDILYCWGNNNSGPLGVGSGSGFRNNPTPVNIPDSKKVKAVSVTELGSCAITTDGLTYCWGANYYGQLGVGSNGSGSDKYSPTPVIYPEGVSSFLTISTGRYHTCALTDDNKAFCWGDNSSGELGDGNIGSGVLSNVPVEVSPSLNLRFKSISAGGQATCAITTDDVSYCWGHGHKIGNGAYSPNKSNPTKVSTTSMTEGAKLSQISVSITHVCATSSDEKVYCWGLMGDNALGNKLNANVIPKPITISSDVKFKAASAGLSYGCALTKTQEIYCWGYNNSGAIGNGTYANTSNPPALIKGSYQEVE